MGTYGVTRLVVPLAAALIAVGHPALAQEHEHGEHENEPRHLEHAHHHGGFPEFVDVYFTHHAYLERKVHPRFDATLAAGENEYEESLEVVWQFNRWLGAEVEGAFIQTDPDEGDGESGFGDVEVAPMVALVTDVERLLIVTARSGFVLPTGDEDKGLGIDGWGWEPALLVWKGFGPERRSALQGELTYDREFLNDAPDEASVVYNAAYTYWTSSNFIPVLEINGSTRVSDEEPEAEGGGDDTIVSATLGFRYAFANGQQWGGGVQFPLTGTDAYDARLVVGGIIHLE